MTGRAIFHPLFVTLEGPDGSGKTTQSGLLADRLSRAGYDVVVTHEPGGGGPIAAEVRRLLLHGGEMTRQAEALLFFAARAENVANVIRPALEQGQVVLCDRYTDSTLAYQGTGLRMDTEGLRQLHRFATGDLWPHATIVFDLPPDVGLERQDTRNRMEERGLEFARRVRDGFLAQAAREPARYRVVDAVGEREDVHERVWAAFQPFLATAPAILTPDSAEVQTP